MAQQEYARIYDHGSGPTLDNGRGGQLLKSIDTSRFDGKSTRFRGKWLPVQRQDARIDPATHRLGPPATTILKTKVKITRAAIPLTTAEKRGRIIAAREAAYQQRSLTVDAMTRAIFHADIDPDELTRLRNIRDAIDKEHPLP